MSFLSPPQNVTGSVITLVNPANRGYQQQVTEVQIRNASPWVLTMPGPTGTVMIDPFTAATQPAIQGQDAVITPSLNAYPALASGYLSAEWIGPNETPSEPDGPMTAAATVSSILATPSSSVIVPSPPAGSDWQTTFAVTGTLVSVVAVFGTSATAASRQPLLRLTDAAAKIIFEVPPPALQTASETAGYNWFPGTPAQWISSAITPDHLATIPIPAGIVVSAGWELGTITVNAQTTDAWFDIAIVLG